MAKQRGTKRNADSVEVEDTGDSEKHVIAKQRGTKRKKHPVEIEGTEDLPTTKRQRSQSPPARRKAPRARKHDGDSSENDDDPIDWKSILTKKDVAKGTDLSGTARPIRKPLYIGKKQRSTAPIPSISTQNTLSIGKKQRSPTPSKSKALIVGKKQPKKGTTNNSGHTINHTSESKCLVTSPASSSSMKESDNYTDMDSSISEYASAVENEAEHSEVAMQLDPVKEQTNEEGMRPVEQSAAIATTSMISTPSSGRASQSASRETTPTQLSGLQTPKARAAFQSSLQQPVTSNSSSLNPKPPLLPALVPDSTLSPVRSYSPSTLNNLESLSSMIVDSQDDVATGTCTVSIESSATELLTEHSVLSAETAVAASRETTPTQFSSLSQMPKARMAFQTSLQQPVTADNPKPPPVPVSDSAPVRSCPPSAANNSVSAMNFDSQDDVAAGTISIEGSATDLPAVLSAETATTTSLATVTVSDGTTMSTLRMQSSTKVDLRKKPKLYARQPERPSRGLSFSERLRSIPGVKLAQNVLGLQGANPASKFILDPSSAPEASITLQCEPSQLASGINTLPTGASLPSAPSSQVQFSPTPSSQVPSSHAPSFQVPSSQAQSTTTFAVQVPGGRAISPSSASANPAGQGTNLRTSSSVNSTGQGKNLGMSKSSNSTGQCTNPASSSVHNTGQSKNLEASSSGNSTDQRTNLASSPIKSTGQGKNLKASSLINSAGQGKNLASSSVNSTSQGKNLASSSRPRSTWQSPADSATNFPQGYLHPTAPPAMSSNQYFAFSSAFKPAPSVPSIEKFTFRNATTVGSTQQSGPSGPLPVGPLPVRPPTGDDSPQSNEVQPDYNTLIRLMASNFDSMTAALQKNQEGTTKFLEELRANQAKLALEMKEAIKQRPPSTSGHVASVRSRRKGQTRISAIDQFKDHPMWLYFQECIRKHLRQLLQVDKLDEELLKFGPLSAEEEEAYNSDDPLRSSRITAEEFRMVLSESIDSPFNMAAQDVFVEEFLDAIKVRGWYPTQVIPDEFLHEKVVLEALRIHLKHVHTTYREVSSPNPRQRRTVRLRRTARTSRKGTLFDARYAIVSKDYQMSYHCDLMEKLGRQGVSSDESDYSRQPPIFNRISPVWRSDELRDFLWRLDELAAEDGKRPIGKRRRGQNQWTRQRPRTARRNIESVAPPGLPINCYDEAWLNDLPPRQRQALDVQPAYDFTLLIDSDLGG